MPMRPAQSFQSLQSLQSFQDLQGCLDDYTFTMEDFPHGNYETTANHVGQPLFAPDLMQHSNAFSDYQRTTTAHATFYAQHPPYQYGYSSPADTDDFQLQCESLGCAINLPAFPNTTPSEGIPSLAHSPAASQQLNFPSNAGNFQPQFENLDCPTDLTAFPNTSPSEGVPSLVHTPQQSDYPHCPVRPFLSVTTDQGRRRQDGTLKTRPEVDVPVSLCLDPLPQGITTLQLDHKNIHKPKHMQASMTSVPASETLQLRVDVVSATWLEKDPNALLTAFRYGRNEVPYPVRPATWDIKPSEYNENINHPAHALNGGEVKTCKRCIERERKRFSDERESKVLKDSKIKDLWEKNIRGRQVAINAEEYVKWNRGESAYSTDYDPKIAGLLDLRIRLGCICGHHKEGKGFHVVFTLTNANDEAVVAQTITEPIWVANNDNKNRLDYQYSFPMVSHHNPSGLGADSGHGFAPVYQGILFNDFAASSTACS